MPLASANAPTVLTRFAARLRPIGAPREGGSRVPGQRLGRRGRFRSTGGHAGKRSPSWDA